MLNNLTNFASIIRDRMVKKETVPTDLIALGRADAGYDGGYRPIAISAKDLIQQVVDTVNNTKHYELDITTTSVVIVDTPKGIIDILGMGSSAPLTPDPAYASSVTFLIDNPDLDLTIANRDNVYVQYSVYYKNTITDNAIPYLIATGISTGLEFNLYNANPTLAGVNNWDGALYVYYELYTIN
jgi:hypothetical protein